MNFQSFIHPNRIPTNGTIHARISDNVLEPEDWNVWELWLKNDKVIGQVELRKGIYGPKDFVGMDRAALAEWSCFDCTGSHPEQFHEISVGD